MKTKSVLTLFFISMMAIPATATSRTLWPVPKSEKIDLSKIVGAYQYTLEDDALCSVSVVVEYTSSSGSAGDASGISGGDSFYGWASVFGEYTIPGVACGWDKDASGNDVYLELPIKTVSPYLSGSGSNLSKLTSVTVSEGIETLSGAFNGADGLKSVSLPSTLKTIGGGTFRNCSSLTSIDIPDSVETIGTRAFLGCGKLRSVEFPASLAVVGEQAFQDSGVASVVLPGACTAVGQYAFSGCGSLVNVDLGGCIEIGSYAFQNCSRLSSVDFPSSLQSIGGSAFVGCSSLSSVRFSSGVVSIGSSAFSSCAALSELELPAGLETIGEKAFQYCTGITRLVVPASVASTGASAFYKCAPKELVEGAFWSMTYSNVTNFTLLPGLETFGTKFKNSAALERVSLPATVKKIEQEAFYGCTNLVSTSIPDSVEIVGNSAFYNCKKLAELPLLGGSVTNWGSSVFRYCTGVERLTVPANVKAIPDYMFANCSNLCDVVVPEGVETVHARAFLCDDSIRKLSLPSTATNLSYATYSKTDYAKNLEVATFHQLRPPKNVVNAFLRNFTGHLYYPPDHADEWQAALSDAGIAAYGKSWAEATEDEPGAVEIEGCSIPYGWLAKYGLTRATIPEKAAISETGKRDASGNAMQAWHDYVAGTNPTDIGDVFTAYISLDNATGKPKIGWLPELSETEAAKRTYKKFGKANLADADWSLVTDNEQNYKFFKVTVEMK